MIIIYWCPPGFHKDLCDREVLAYVTDTEKGNGTKRLFFSTIFSEDLKVFFVWEGEHSSSDQTDHDPVTIFRCYYMPFDGRSKSVTMTRKRSGLFATIWYGVARGIEMLVNLINISYCAMKILPYQDKYFSKYRTKSVQEFLF